MLGSPLRQVNRAVYGPARLRQTADIQRGSRVQRLVPIIGVAIATLLALHALRYLWCSHRRRQRERVLEQLLTQADHFEAALKDCRARLDAAHAVMTALPGVAAGSDGGRGAALAAVNAGLRDLLAHRLWLRDQASHTDLGELERTLAAMSRTQDRLAGQVSALGVAQNALTAALRERGITQPQP